MRDVTQNAEDLWVGLVELRLKGGERDGKGAYVHRHHFGGCVGLKLEGLVRMSL